MGDGLALQWCVIDFTVDGCLRVDGKVVSDSPDTADNGRGHAAGGAINITAGTIAGAATGRISAKASRDVQCGGRVAVKLTKSGATFDDYAGSFNVKGGGSLTGSSAGSVYLQAGAEDDKAGTIIIDNFNANGVSTPICATGYDADQVNEGVMSFAIDSFARKMILYVRTYTWRFSMSITLSIPPTIVQEVRVWAEENGTSLNQYIRDCLEAKVNELAALRRNRADQFESLCLSQAVKAPKGWRFDRAALYEERHG